MNASGDLGKVEENNRRRRATRHKPPIRHDEIRVSSSTSRRQDKN